MESLRDAPHQVVMNDARTDGAGESLACSDAKSDAAKADDPKWFNCQSCGKSLSASEVVPIFMTGCCGFIAACAKCAQSADRGEAAE